MKTATDPILAEPRKNDDHSAFARETHGLHPAWQFVRCSYTEDAAPPGTCRIEGAAFEVLKSGKRKGQPNYRKAIPGTERTLFLVSAELQAWRDRREVATGVCQRCHGEGEIGPSGLLLHPGTLVIQPGA